MAIYVIEGTISELTKRQNGISIKISGSEGYSVKQDKKKYNVFCPKDMPKEDKSVLCCITGSQFELPIATTVKYENILAQALVSGKRVRLTLEVDDTKTLEECVNEKQSIPLKSLTLLQN